MNEEEEFEFRHRMEQEAATSATAATEQAEPSYLAVAGNAAAKGAAGFADMFLNAPVNAYNVAKAGAIAASDVPGMKRLNTLLRDNLDVTPQPNLVEKGAREFGLISDEREPQTPGQRILDMAVQAGVGMVGSPANSALQVAKAGAIGLASGAAAGVTQEATDSPLAATAVGMAVPLASRGVPSKANAPILRNPTKLQTAQEGMAAGLVVPPSHLKPSFSNQRIESFGGKAATKQAANIKNVETTDRLVAEELGLPAGQPLTPTGVLDVRREANKVYEKIANISPKAKQELAQLKESRLDASDGWMDYARSRRADARREAVAADARSEIHERAIEYEAKIAPQFMDQATVDIQTLKAANGFQFRNLESGTSKKAVTTGPIVIDANGAVVDGNHRLREALVRGDKTIEILRPSMNAEKDILGQLREARTLIAKTHNIEDSMNVGDGHVSAAYLGGLLQNDKPLTGNLELIGKFAKAFPDVMRDASRVPVAGVSALDATMMAGLGTAGFYGSGGDPQGALLGALPLLRGPARAMLLSKSKLGIPGTTGMQQRLLKEAPSLTPALLQSILAGRSTAEAR